MALTANELTAANTLLNQGVGCRMIALMLALAEKAGVNPVNVANAVAAKHADVFALVVDTGYTVEVTDNKIMIGGAVTVEEL
jgi:ABC-type antimicrobial peptide transport system ATPase subunit